VAARSSPIAPFQRRSPERHRVISRVHPVIMLPLRARSDFRNSLRTAAAALCRLLIHLDCVSRCLAAAKCGEQNVHSYVAKQSVELPGPRSAASATNDMMTAAFRHFRAPES